VNCSALPAHLRHGDIYPVPPEGCPVGTPHSNPNVFSDVDQSNPFFIGITELHEMSAISGYSDGTFRWGNDATRAQLVKIVVIAFGYPLNPGTTPTFSDVPTNHPFYNYIQTAYSNELISGYDDGTFRPYNNITRGQLSKIVVGAAHMALLIPTSATFSDVPVGSPFFAYVETAYGNGIVSGYSDGTFRPGNNATRGQLSKIVDLGTHPPE
jgi:hypothetical protein